MHANTRLSVHSRQKLIKDYLSGKSMTKLAQMHGISRKTAYGWLNRYREEGPAGLRNRSSCPLQLRYRLSPTELATLTAVRRKTWWGPVRLSSRVKASPSTLYRALCRLGLQRRPRVYPAVIRY